MYCIDAEYSPYIWIHLYHQRQKPKAPDCFGRAHSCHCCLGLVPMINPQDAMSPVHTATCHEKCIKTFLNTVW